MGDSSQDEWSNTLRILIATDCHLGYAEKDEIRRHDSFQAFEEICSIADKKQVDFLLLGGDLFHENKPSRSTLVQAIEILRRHCMNDRPVQFQVVSDQAVNFANKFGRVNYEDPYFTVGLPVFSIHGNHDDPAGVDNLSAVDILSACNLVNYFGKMILEGSGVGQINLSPILIKKGLTSVAMYGLGNIRDERLNRMFQTPHAVEWTRPDGQEDSEVSDWFNILVLHQNRVKSNPKNAINEHFLPRFLDFVVWGHEHECLIDPQEVPGMGFHVTQPGSSVATSLIDGESKPKHVLLLEIKGSQYRPTKIPLHSVRPFEYADVVLKDVPDIDPNDQTSILEHLDTVVNDLIAKAKRKAGNKSEPKLPLIRIKVDYSGFTTINPQRFGQKYVGKVANPQDILIFSKTSRRGDGEGKFSDAERLRPEELNQQNIEALVAESNLKMEILPVNDLDVALQNFVNKDDKMAFHSCVRYNLEETRNKLANDSDPLKFEEQEDLILKVGECLEERVKGRSTQPKDFLDLSSGTQSMKDSRKKGAGTQNDFFSDDEDASQMFTSKATSSRKKGSTTSTRLSRDVPDSGGSQTAARGRGRGGRGRGRGRTASNLKQTTLEGFRHSERSASAVAASAVQSIARVEDIDSDSSDETEKYDVNEVVVDSSENEDSSFQGKSRKRAAPKGRSKATASSSRQSKKTDSSSSIHKMFMANRDDDDDDDDDDEDEQRKRLKIQPRVTRNYGAVRR
uniref:Double-strand break repair protein n=1 Tax=Kalanchoe fedtschenkoi TaxID=63787 RepID=A0A7N0SXW4_KALFE